MLHILSDKKKRFFYESQIGKEGKVLFEDEVQNGQMLGFTGNYVRVAVKYDPLLINETKEIRYDHINAENLMEVTEIQEEILAH
jgi:threonylcarbamoyladenosine tRNA methylthiotransferase MtaB